MMWNVIYDTDNKKSEVFEWGKIKAAPKCHIPEDLNQDKSTE